MLILLLHDNHNYKSRFFFIIIFLAWVSKLTANIVQKYLDGEALQGTARGASTKKILSAF